MSLENPRGTESTVSDNSKIRRTFLKRATAGIVIASIPGRSAWAGIAGSIVASGHGSDFQQGDCTKLLGAASFDNSTYRTTDFASIFGGNPFNNGGRVRTNGGTDRNGALTFGDIFDAHFDSRDDDTKVRHYRGINRVNVGIVVMYLNAVNDNVMGIVYPVLSQHRGSKSNFAHYLYNAGLADAENLGTLLNNTVSAYSNGRGCI
jgi:hypothetical protein